MSSTISIELCGNRMSCTETVAHTFPPSQRGSTIRKNPAEVPRDDNPRFVVSHESTAFKNMWKTRDSAVVGRRCAVIRAQKPLVVSGDLTKSPCFPDRADRSTPNPGAESVEFLG